MKIIILIYLQILVIAFNTTAQDSLIVKKDTLQKPHKIKEYYLSVTNFNPINLGFRYKKQLRKNRFFKLSLVDLQAQYTNLSFKTSTSFPISAYNYKAGIEIGLEFRKKITNSFSLYHGPNIGNGANYQISKFQNPAIPIKQQKTINENYYATIPYTLGILMHVTNQFYLSAELNPS